MDYTKFQPIEAGSKSSLPQFAEGYWWDAEEPKDRAALVIASASHVKEMSHERSMANLRHARLYGNFDQLGFGPRDYTRTASHPTNRIALNVIASCIDTLVSKIAKNSPRPSFQTTRGNFKQRQKAKRLDQFVRGLFYEAEVYKHTAVQFFDGCWAGTGVLKVFLNHAKRIRVERTFPDELYVDDVDGMYGAPRQLYQRKLIPRDVLLADPDFSDSQEKVAAITEAATPSEAEATRGFGDVVEVWESWHLPAYKGAGDGHHVIAIDGCELYHEEWKHEFFPFVFFRYKPRVLGFWGQGLAEELTGIQLEINRLLRSVSEQLRRKGRGRVFLHGDSKVVPAHLTNGIGDVVKYFGTNPPVVDNSNAVAQEEFVQLDRLVRYAYQLAGISEMSAGSKKPSGLDSAVAIREFSDVESERFALTGKRYEAIFLDLAKVMLALVGETGGSGYKVKVAGKRVVDEIDWKDIQLDEESYTIQMFPVSSLPQLPSARRQAVKELLQDGVITDMAEYRRLLDFPDLEEEGNLAAAALDDVDNTISKILDEEKPEYIPPDEHQNLQLLISRARAAYLRAKHEGAEENRLSKLRTLIDQASALVLKAQKPPAPAAAPAAPAPMPAAPMPGMPPIDINMLPAGPQPAVPPLTAPAAPM